MRAATLVLIATCAPPAQAPSTDLTARTIARLWPDGCFTTGALESDHARCTTPRRPYSTFKIANALVGLDLGVVAGADAPLPWDRARVPEEDWFTAPWKQPQTLRSAFRISAVPSFKTLALDIGEARMRAGLAKLRYGNQDISGGLDKFWLSGGLRISAADQLRLADELAHGKLVVSPHAQEVLREISVVAREDQAVLHGKTGAGPTEDRSGGHIVWQVGWVERGGTIQPYAAWLDLATGTTDEARAVRDRRLRATFAALGWFPASPLGDRKGAVIVQDLATGRSLVEEGTVDQAVMPLSVVKVFVSAVWHEHGLGDGDFTRPNGQHVKADDILVDGWDTPGEQMAIALRRKYGETAIAGELHRLGIDVPTGLDEATWGRTLSIGEQRMSVTARSLCASLRAVAQLGTSTAARLYRGMRGAVERGTAKSAAPMLAGTTRRLGGKTGTGPEGQDVYDGWFAGFIFDGDAPRYAVCVRVERAGPGGGVAAGIAAQLARALP